MNQPRIVIALVFVLPMAAAIGSRAAMAPPLQIARVTCETPPPLHCPESDCPGAMVTEQGTAVEPKTGRRFFLDYPCDLKRGEKVIFVLSLHGGVRDGRVVADVVRLEKGHTEGLEPHVTEALVKLMVSARGGKAQRGS
jgi:hypothetical protein